MAGRNYSRKESPALSDLSLIWDAANSDWRLSTLSNIQTLFDSDDTTDRPVTQYLSPLTGFNVTVTDGGSDTQDVHLLLTPAGTLATGTITLPAVPVDKMTVLVTTTNAITTLAVSANGNTVRGEPSTLAADGYFTLKYDSVNSTWYRVG